MKQNITIAIANSELLFTEAITKLLIDNGFEVVTIAQNGKDLIHLIENLQKKPDVCIIDVFMPYLSGLATTEELYKRWPQLRVLVLSSFESSQIVTRMLMAGACAYLKMNISFQMLSDAIIAVHNNGVYFSDLVSSQYWKAIQKKQVRLPCLTATELQMLKYCCMDITYEEIANQLHTTVTSIKGRRDSLFKKLEIHNRVGVFKFAIENGIDLFSDMSFCNNDGSQFYHKPHST